MTVNRRNFLFRSAGAAAAAGLPAAAKIDRESGVKLKLGLNAYSFDKPLRAGSMTLADAVHFLRATGRRRPRPHRLLFPRLSQRSDR